MSADGKTIFHPRRGRLLTVGTICLVLGLLVAWGAALNVVHLHRAGLVAPPQNGPITSASSLIFIGMFCLLMVIRGVPRLEIDGRAWCCGLYFGRKRCGGRIWGHFPCPPPPIPSAGGCIGRAR